MDVPQQHNLEDDGDEHDDEDGEEDGLVVEHGHSLRGGANFEEPVELAHYFFWFGGMMGWKWLYIRFYRVKEEIV